MKEDERKKISDRMRLCWEAMFYSEQRIDLLIVAICGGGIYTCLETLKHLDSKGLPVHLTVKIAGVGFLLGIVINLVGQHYGKKANEQDFLWCDARLDNESEEECKRFDQKADKYTDITKALNLISLVLLSVGLLSIMYFFICFF